MTLLKKVLSTWHRSLNAFASTHTRQAQLNIIAKELAKFEGGSVDLEKDESTGIAVMTLNNPKRHNSITGQMMIEMAEKITLLEKWSSGKGLILMGANGTFCSGGDLEFVRKALHYGSEMAMFMHDTLTRLFNLPLASVALVQGHALGGGAELSTACDFRVMSSNARLGFIHIKMGLTPGWGTTTRLVQLLGRNATLDILTSAKVFNAQDAKERNLVNHILPPSEDEFAACKEWLLSNHCKYDADLIQGLKSSIVSCDRTRDIAISLGEERKIFHKFWGGTAHLSALSVNAKHK